MKKFKNIYGKRKRSVNVICDHAVEKRKGIGNLE